MAKNNVPLNCDWILASAIDVFTTSASMPTVYIDAAHAGVSRTKCRRLNQGNCFPHVSQAANGRVAQFGLPALFQSLDRILEIKGCFFNFPWRPVRCGTASTHLCEPELSGRMQSFAKIYCKGSFLAHFSAPALIARSVQKFPKIHECPKPRDTQ